MSDVNDKMTALFAELEAREEAGLDSYEEAEFARLHGGSDVSADEVLSAINMSLDKGELSVRETMFAVKAAQGGNLRAAYVEVYETGHLLPESISRMACRLAKKPFVAAKIAEYRRQLSLAAEQSVPSLIGVIHEAIGMARAQQDPKAMMSGVDRLSGLLGLGENQKRRESGVVVLDLDPMIREKLEREIARTYALESDVIDVTPDDDVEAKPV